ncbi:MAG: RidA family protein [Bacteroidota bacterium]
MERKFITSGAPNVPLTPAIKVGNLIFISGQVPVDLKTGKDIRGDIKVETEAVLKRIKFYVEQCGGTMKDIVKTTVLLTNINDFAEMNKVYAKFFPENPPARACMEIRLACDAKIEIEAIAVLPEK